MLHLGFSVSVIMLLFAWAEAGIMHQIFTRVINLDVYGYVPRFLFVGSNPLKATFAVDCDMPIVAASFESGKFGFSLH